MVSSRLDSNLLIFLVFDLPSSAWPLHTASLLRPEGHAAWRGQGGRAQGLDREKRQIASRDHPCNQPNASPMVLQMGLPKERHRSGVGSVLCDHIADVLCLQFWLPE